MRHARGFTLVEIVTTLVVVAVLVAVAVPMWRVHLLRVRRADAITALIDVQNAQDRYFSRNARYASGAQLTAVEPDGLGLRNRSEHGYYDIEVQSGDGLAFTAIARANEQTGQAADARCAQLSIDQNGLRHAVDSTGKDRSGDCWH